MVDHPTPPVHPAIHDAVTAERDANIKLIDLLVASKRNQKTPITEDDLLAVTAAIRGRAKKPV